MSTKNEIETLKLKINELEQELSEKNKEVSLYKKEVHKINSDLEKIISDLNIELKLASKIQKILSPTETPRFPGFEFSTKFISGSDIGGDYFDIFEHEDKMKFGVVMACSSGYAMSALFLSVLIKLSSQIEARRGLSADKVLLNMAKELISSIENEDTASVFYGIMDRRTFEFQYACSGKIYGFLLPHDSQNVSRLEPSSGSFCKGFNEKPLAQTLQFSSKDRLVICSEGILEAKNKDNEKFGFNRLSSVLQDLKKQGVHDVRNEVLFRVEQFAGLTEPVRDQTLIVIEVKDKVIKLAKN